MCGNDMTYQVAFTWYVVLVNPMCSKRFHRHCSGNRHYRGTTAVVYRMSKTPRWQPQTPCFVTIIKVLDILDKKITQNVCVNTALSKPPKSAHIMRASSLARRRYVSLDFTSGGAERGEDHCYRGLYSRLGRSSPTV